MRLEASFSAVGLFVLLTLSDNDWGRMLARYDAGETIDVARCSSLTRLVEKANQYDFYGARADAAGHSLRQRLLITTDFAGRQKRFTGQTDWHIEWRACFEAMAQGCRIGGVVSTVNVTYTLPRWFDREAAPPHLRDRWDRYLTSLAAHEKGHGAIAHKVAGMIEEALVGLADPRRCDTLSADAGRVVDQVMQRGESLQREYDRVTAHGSTQGALFPF